MVAMGSHSLVVRAPALKQGTLGSIPSDCPEFFISLGGMKDLLCSSTAGNWLLSS